MATIIKKRKPFDAVKLTTTEEDYFLLGFDMFHDLDLDRMPEKWEIYREKLLKQWYEPGKRPWAWWNIDHPEYRRKIYNAKDFNYFSDTYSFGYPTGWSGKDWPVIETQAAFLKRKGLLTPAEVKYFKTNEMETKETTN